MLKEKLRDIELKAWRFRPITKTRPGLKRIVLGTKIFKKILNSNYTSHLINFIFQKLLFFFLLEKWITDKPNLALRVYSRWWVTIPVSEIGTPAVPLPVAVPSWLRSFRPSDLAGLFVNVNAAPSFIFLFHFFSIFAVRILFVSREGRDLFLFFLLFAVLRLLSWRAEESPRCVGVSQWLGSTSGSRTR